MRRTSFLVLGALLLLGGALCGVQLSGASWSGQSGQSVKVSALPDWAPPTVTVSVAFAVNGTASVAAVATDDRSTLASVTLAYSADGTTWTPITTGCSSESGPSPLTYSCGWDTTGLFDGTYQLRATAADSYGHTAVSPATSTQVVNSAAIVLDPVPSAVRGQVQLKATFYQAVIPTAKITIAYSTNGTTWTTITGCTGEAVSSATCTWTTTTVSNGSYTLRATAEAGTLTVTDTQVVTVDNQAPTVNLTVPAGTLQGTVTLTATAADADSLVDSVLFEYQREGDASWTSCPADTMAPYVCAVNTTSRADGTYLFRATATDAAGNTTTTATQTRTVTNEVATVAISSPTQGSTVGGTVSVTAAASSPNGIDSVRIEARVSAGFFATVCTDTTSPYSCAWDTTALFGAHELRAVLTEAGGATITSTTVAVDVSNTVGTVSIASPTSAIVTGVATVSVIAFSPSGVQAVTVQTSPRNEGTWTTACTARLSGGAYSCSWDTTAIVNGLYDVRAVMTQTSGPPVTSAVVTVTVDNVGGLVSLTSPVTGSVSGGVSVTATAPVNSRAMMTYGRSGGTTTITVAVMQAVTEAGSEADFA